MLEMSDAIRQIAGELMPLCALTAALELLIRDDASSLGFRAVCGLSIALGALKSVLRMIG